MENFELFFSVESENHRKQRDKLLRYGYNNQKATVQHTPNILPKFFIFLG